MVSASASARRLDLQRDGGGGLRVEEGAPQQLLGVLLLPVLLVVHPCLLGASCLHIFIDGSAELQEPGG